MSKLPKLYRPVVIKFWSLRNGFGEGYGVIFDIDTEIERLAMRVRCDGGWKWQIKNVLKMSEWDWPIVQDQEILDNYGSEAEVIVTN